MNYCPLLINGQSKQKTMTYKEIAIAIGLLMFIPWSVLMVRLWREGNEWKKETERLKKVIKKSRK